MQDERKTFRNQEISVNSWNEELCSSDRSGQPGITQDVISVQTCPSEDSKSLNVERTHDRSGKPGKHNVAVKDDPEVYREAETLNVDDDWKLEKSYMNEHTCHLDSTKDLITSRMDKGIGRKLLDNQKSKWLDNQKQKLLDKHNFPTVQDDPQVYLGAGTLNIDDKTNRNRIEADMDFKIPGLPHSVVKHAKNASARELIQKIENHPDWHALQRDLRQNQAFKPFSPELKLIEVGNIELCELLETESKAKCKVCSSYWDICIVYCTCGHFLRKGREENQKFIKYTMDLVSIPDYVLKKGRPHGHRYGKKPWDNEYYIANQLNKKCKKRCFQGIRDKFIRDEQFHSRMIEKGRDEDLCRQMDDFADEDHTHHMTSHEYFYYKSDWWLRSNKTGSDTMTVQRRYDFKQALSTVQQLKQKEGAQRNQRWAQNSSSSSSSSWWLQMDRSQLTSVYCNRREV